MRVGIVRETFPGERRVALIPADLPKLAKVGLTALLEPGAGDSSGYLDSEYVEKGATLVSNRAEALAAEIVVQVRSLGANPQVGAADLPHFKSSIVIGMCDPLGNPEAAPPTADAGVTQFALELIPRITRAQSMDVLSSMATIAGYRAVILASSELPKIFPMLMTAAGTVKPAKVLIIGVGVAGLQAIATAKRLGAVVHAYDVRPACREQVESLGGKFLELDLDAGQSEDKGGYAKALGEEFYQRQRELLADFIEDCDVVISTAAIPGRQSPLLVTEDAVKRMAAGGVIVDLAAERGGNCELSQADERVVAHGVTILGPTNLPAEIPKHASQMFSSNVTRFLLNMVDKESGEVAVDLSDEIIAETLETRDGEVRNSRMREALNLPPLAEDPSDEDPSDEEMAIDESDDDDAPLALDVTDESDEAEDDSKNAKAEGDTE
jgi:NAD(P) transhydrogenase subunit alpha